MRSARYPQWVCVAAAGAGFFILLPLATLLVRSAIIVIVGGGWLGPQTPDWLVTGLGTALVLALSYGPARIAYGLLRWKTIEVDRPNECRVCGCDLSDCTGRRCPACGTSFE